MVQIWKLVGTSVLAFGLVACGGGGSSGGSFQLTTPNVSADSTPAVVAAVMSTTGGTSGDTTTIGGTGTGTGTGSGSGAGGTGSTSGSGGSGGGATNPPVNPPTVNPLSVTVYKGASLVAADNAGEYRIKPGSIFVWVSSSVTRWTVNSSTPSAIFITPASVPTQHQWAAALANASTTTQTVTISAEYVEGTSTKTVDIVLKVAAPDARSGQYWVFAGSGMQYRINANFDDLTYEVTTSGNMPFQAGGVLAEDSSEPGTFIMLDANTTLTTFNPNRFRISEDVMVGNYLFDTGFASMTFARNYYPFVAVKTTAMVTQQALLDGLYTRIEMRLRDSQTNGVQPTPIAKVSQAEISQGGTRMVVCQEATQVSTLAACTGTIETYTGIDGGFARWWTFTSATNPQDKLDIGAVRIGGETVLLEAYMDMANYSSATGSENVFRLSAPATTPWVDAVSLGGDTKGTWNKYSISLLPYPGSYQRQGTQFDGTTSSSSWFTLIPPPAWPTGLRQVYPGLGSSNGYMLQSSRLTAMVGTGGSYKGYVALGLKE